jgi:hypothetical protein
MRGAAFALLGHGSILCTASRAAWFRPHCPTIGVMASRGASVNPLTAVPDRSEIAAF